MYFLGFVFGGVFGFLSDKYGRRKSLILLFGVHLAAITVLLFSTSYLTRIIAFFVMGLAQVKNSISLVWVFESFPN